MAEAVFFYALAHKRQKAGLVCPQKAKRSLSSR
jgi:hypothetical protein